MAILLKNNGIIPECNEQNYLILSERVAEPSTNITRIQRELEQFNQKINSYRETDPVIAEIKRATSFHIEDIAKILVGSPDCKYLRVYHGYTDAGKFITYIAPISASFDSYINEDSSDTSIISASCCQCKPCSKDKLLNP